MTDNKQLIDDEAKVIASKLADVMAKDAGDLHVDPYMAPDDWGIIPASQLEDAVKNNLMHVTDIRKSKGQYDPYVEIDASIGQGKDAVSRLYVISRGHILSHPNGFDRKKMKWTNRYLNSYDFDDSAYKYYPMWSALKNDPNHPDKWAEVFTNIVNDACKSANKQIKQNIVDAIIGENNYQPSVDAQMEDLNTAFNNVDEIPYAGKPKSERENVDQSTEDQNRTKQDELNNTRNTVRNTVIDTLKKAIYKDMGLTTKSNNSEDTHEHVTQHVDSIIPTDYDYFPDISINVNYDNGQTVPFVITATDVRKDFTMNTNFDDFAQRRSKVDYPKDVQDEKYKDWYEVQLTDDIDKLCNDAKDQINKELDQAETKHTNSDKQTESKPTKLEQPTQFEQLSLDLDGLDDQSKQL